jgi:hypothetical protein
MGRRGDQPRGADGCERWRATVAVAVVICLAFAGAAGAVTLLSWAFSAAMSLGRGSREYKAVAPESIYLACVLVPWALSVQLLRHRLWPNRILFPVLVASVIGIVWPQNAETRPWLEEAGQVLFAGLLLLGWPFFLLALRDACAHAPWMQPRSEDAEAQ